MKLIEAKGTSINTKSTEIATIIRIFAMSIIKMSNIKMYRQAKTRLPWIAEKVTRDRFFNIRHSKRLLKTTLYRKRIGK